MPQWIQTSDPGARGWVIANRLPWGNKVKLLPYNGIWPACFVATATVFRGSEYRNLIAKLPQAIRLDDAYIEWIVIISRWIVSSAEPFVLAPFEPDILGETFFMMLWRELALRDNDLTDAYTSMFKMMINKTVKPNVVGENFIIFFGRLLNNLCNDDVLSGDSYTNWRTVVAFLSNEFFLSASIEVQHLSTIAMASVFTIMTRVLVAVAATKDSFLIRKWYSCCMSARQGSTLVFSKTYFRVICYPKAVLYT